MGSKVQHGRMSLGVHFAKKARRCQARMSVSNCEIAVHEPHEFARRDPDRPIVDPMGGHLAESATILPNRRPSDESQCPKNRDLPAGNRLRSHRATQLKRDQYTRTPG